MSASRSSRTIPTSCSPTAPVGAARPGCSSVWSRRSPRAVRSPWCSGAAARWPRRRRWSRCAVVGRSSSSAAPAGWPTRSRRCGRRTGCPAVAGSPRCCRAATGTTSRRPARPSPIWACGRSCVTVTCAWCVTSNPTDLPASWRGSCRTSRSSSRPGSRSRPTTSSPRTSGAPSSDSSPRSWSSGSSPPCSRSCTSGGATVPCTGQWSQYQSSPQCSSRWPTDVQRASAGCCYALQPKRSRPRSTATAPAPARTPSSGPLTPYEGPLPPQMYGASRYDDGLSPLDSSRYLATRVADQLSYYHGRIGKLDRSRNSYQLLAIASAGAGALLAAAGAEIWIGLTTTISVAATAYLANLQLDNTIVAYNQSANKLSGLLREWSSRTANGPARAPFEDLVARGEAVLTTELSGWVQQMNDALRQLQENHTKPDTEKATTAYPRR